MDLSSIIGLLVGAMLIMMSILINPAASFGGFIDVPSVMVVIGGAMSATLISFPLRNVLNAFAVMKCVFFNRQQNIATTIELLVSLAETARRDGLLALEGRIDELDDPFVVMGIQMAVDGMRPETIEDIMRTEIDAVATRHKNGKGILDAMGRFAPAFGMIGTLMGLVIMLGDMKPETIGSGMAIALLTTLYGAIISNLVFLPMADKLKFINDHELLVMEISVRGIMAIQQGENPRVIEQKLSTFIPPKLRTAPSEEGGE